MQKPVQRGESPTKGKIKNKNMGVSSGPSAISRSYIVSVVLAGFALLFHLGCIIAHAFAIDDDYIKSAEEKFYQKYGHRDYPDMTPAHLAAIVLSFASIIL